MVNVNSMSARLKKLMEAVADEVRAGYVPLTSRFVSEHDVSDEEYETLRTFVADAIESSVAHVTCVNETFDSVAVAA